MKKEIDEINITLPKETFKKIVEKRLRVEIARGVQTIQYQVVTLMTTNGQAPFVTVFMYLNEAKNEQEKADLAIIIEEVLKAALSRVLKMKRESGLHPLSQNLYMYSRMIIFTEGDPYYYSDGTCRRNVRQKEWFRIIYPKKLCLKTKLTKTARDTAIPVWAAAAF